MTVGAHIAALAVVIWASHRVGEVAIDTGTDVTFLAPAPPPPPPPPPPAGGGGSEPAKRERPKEKPKKDPAIDTRKTDLTPEPRKPSDSTDKGEPGGVAGGQAGGVQGGVPGGVVGGTVGGQSGGTPGGKVGDTGTETDVVPFGDGMTRPPPLDPDEIQYTAEARATRASGVMVVRCTIRVDGTTTNCRVLKSVATMDSAVVAALTRRRTPPVLFQGHPVAVDYTYTIRLKMP